MIEIVVNGVIRIPAWVRNLASFRRWTVSAEYPNRGEISFLGDMLWVDPTPERVSHNQIRVAITATVGCLVNAGRLGRYYSRGMRLVHPTAGLSTEPDAFFASRDSFKQGRVRLPHGDESLEVIGSPDMVLEVVSPTSVEKDAVRLLELYHKAGVREYWLVNPLGDILDYRIYRAEAGKLTAARSQRSWLRSGVFDRAFRLTEAPGLMDLTNYTLEVR